MFPSDDVILVTRDGAPAGVYLPWDTPELPVEARREVFLRLSDADPLRPLLTLLTAVLALRRLPRSR